MSLLTSLHNSAKACEMLNQNHITWSNDSRSHREVIVGHDSVKYWCSSCSILNTNNNTIIFSVYIYYFKLSPSINSINFNIRIQWLKWTLSTTFNDCDSGWLLLNFFAHIRQMAKLQSSSSMVGCRGVNLGGTGGHDPRIWSGGRQYIMSPRFWHFLCIFPLFRASAVFL